MNLPRLSLFGLSLSLLAVACASPASDEPSATAAQDMTAEWLESNIPSGSALERKVLALVNDSTMTSQAYMTECRYTPAVARNILEYREGDGPARSDDQ